MDLHLSFRDYEIIIANEYVGYEPSEANTGTLFQKNFLGDLTERPNSCYNITISRDGKIYSASFFLAGGGVTGVHQNSAFVRENVCYLAIGPYVVGIELPTLKLIFKTQCDAATCFGVYDTPDYQSMISHGELQISRLDYDGKKIWTAGGRDIFTGELTLHESYVKVDDFNNETYKIYILSGISEITS